MDTRFSTNPKDFKNYTTQEIRDEFLIENLYSADTVTWVYSHVDRMVIGGCMPVNEVVSIDKGIDCYASFGTNYVLERREVGVFNLADTGKVTVDGTEYILENKDCLYITKGQKEIKFESLDPQKPAKFYMASTPAHASFETRLLTMKDAGKNPLGNQETASKRVINQFIHPSVLKTSQLLMGMTVLEEGSVRNSFPAHYHDKRMEVYMYFDMKEEDAIVHLMGEPQETRHLIMRNYDAVISPTWSIHSGLGSARYSFIWAMAGDNQDLGDAVAVDVTDLR